VAEHVTPRVGAVIVLLALAILTARMWKRQRRVLGLVKLTAEAIVLRQSVFGVAIVTIRACPAVKSNDLLCNFNRLSLFCLFILIIITVSATGSSPSSVIVRAGSVVGGLRHHHFLLLIIVSVEFLDPLLDATQVERLPTLVAIPKGAPLIYRVVTDQTFLSAL